MRYVRFTAQIITIILQIYFFVETIRLLTGHYVIFLFKPIESSWFSMLFTLLVVIGCEIFGLIDATLFVIMRRSIYSFAYLAMILATVYLFMTLSYYSTFGTTLCLICYGALFAVRILNITLDVIAIAKEKRMDPIDLPPQSN